MPTKVTEILDRVARQCSLTAPSLWLSATTATAKEIRDDFMLEVIEDLQRRIDWPSPMGKQTTITGDGSSVSYALPSDFVRLADDTLAVYETSTVRRYGVPVHSDGEWTHINEIGTAAGSRFFRIEGYEGNWTVSFYPTLDTGESVTVSYVSSVWVVDSGDAEKSVFSDSEDYCVYPRRLVETGIVYRFRKRKGLPYDDVKAEYELILSGTINRLRGPHKISFGDRPGSKPMRYPVPDYIPSS